MEDERTFNPVPDNINQGVVRYLRDAPPSHYSVKIESFSRRVDVGEEKYESATFEASGYSWKLVLYPNGNGRRGGGGHISLYLAIEKTESLPLGWEAYVTYKMFVFDHNKDKYLTIQDDPAVQQIRRFHQAKKESGFHRLISLDTFNAATNGYLVDDCCVFGVEVHKVKNTGNGETVKILEDPEEDTFDWKICDFSKICKEKLNYEDLKSEEFTCGKIKWCLLLYPNGDSRAKDHLSLFLDLPESPTSVKKVSAEFSLVIKNQLSDSHHQRTGEGETIKIFDDPQEFTFDWKICEFSKVCKEKVHPQSLASEEFTCGNSKWRLLLYPNGESRAKDCLSVFIELVQISTSWKKVSAEFSVVIKNQLSDSHHRLTSKELWFSTDSKTESITSGVSKNWGFASFMSLSNLTSESGFIVKDKILIQAKVKIKTEVTSFSEKLIN
ncbi:hypothetical protein AgCh_033447 [Apium graveolens]